MNLLAADLERFSRRRLMRGALILALFLIAVIVAIQTARGHRWTENISTGGGFYTGPDGRLVPDAGGTYQLVHDTRVNVASLSNVLVAVGMMMACLSFVLGASFVGAEFGGSGLSTQLLFEPRRWRVHVSKAVACAISCAAMTCCVLCTLAFAIFVGAKLHGVAQGIDSTFWQERAREIGRGVIGAGLAGSMAYTVAVALRRSAAAIVGFLVQIPLAALLQQRVGLLGTIGRALPYYGLQVFVLGRDHLVNPIDLRGVTTTAAALAMSVAWTVGLVVAAGLVFSRAEVR